MAHEALVNVVQCDRENVSNALYTFNTHTLVSGQCGVLC